MSRFQGDTRARRHEGGAEHRNEAEEHRHKPTVPSSRTAQEKLRQLRAQMNGQQAQTTQNQIRRTTNTQAQAVAAQSMRQPAAIAGTEARPQDQQPIDLRQQSRATVGVVTPDQGLASEVVDLKSASFEPKEGTLFGAIRFVQSAAAQLHVAGVFPGEISGAAKSGDNGDGSSSSRDRAGGVAFSGAHAAIAEEIASMQLQAVMGPALGRMHHRYTKAGPQGVAEWDVLRSGREVHQGPSYRRLAA